MRLIALLGATSYSKTSTMSSHIEFGRKGEDLAADWLVRHGFIIIGRNWRHGRYEVDLIAGRGAVLHFIEVKTRRSLVYGHPEESVSRKKIEHMMQGAAGWLLRRPRYRRVQYDVLAITYAKNNSREVTSSSREERSIPPEIVFFEDVYL